jgi:hypothetical protein
MEHFGLFIGNIGPIDEKMTRKRSNLHLYRCFKVHYLHFSILFLVQKLHFCRKQNRMIKAVMGVEQTTEITTVYI